jgi:ABC-type dipeptide/oligopeptide/nickel transport system permease component
MGTVRMWIYILRRVILIIPVIIGVMTITFILVSFIPESTRIAAFSPGRDAKPGTPLYHHWVVFLGLNQPVPLQWAYYIYHSLTLNWGYTAPLSEASLGAALGQTSYPVAEVLGWYLPYTLELAAIALLLILLIAIPLGNLSAVYRNRPLDQGTRVLSFSGYAFPSFLLAAVVLLAAVMLSGGIVETCNHLSFSYLTWYGSWPSPACLPGSPATLPSWIGPHLETSPTGFPTLDALIHWNTATGPDLAFESVKRMILPALVIAYTYVASILRFVRNSMLEVMNLDFVRTARAKGVPERQVVRRHAGRNSLNVTVTVLGLTFAFFITGFPVIEDVFHLRGIGYLLALSIQPTQDYGLIFGSTLLLTIIVVAANLIVDVTYAYLDPRVRLG